MDRRVKDGLRAGATAVGVAAGLMALASTAQTPDGFIRASFGGPLDVFSKGTSDVLAIGDGSGDPTELAALLKGSSITATGPAAEFPYRAAYEAGATPGATTLNVFPATTGPAAATAIKDAALPPVKPVVDAEGRVDCTGAVSCKTDPTTNVTTVTYPDGVVAIVQKINDLTVVAYKTITEVLPPSVQSILPTIPTKAAPVPDTSAPAPAAVPSQEPAPEPAAAPTPAAPDTTAPVIDPGPLVLDEVDTDEAVRGPRINVTRPPLDFSPDSPLDGLPIPNGPKPDFGLGKVKDALGSVVDGVKDAVGKAIGPGAAGKADSHGNSGNDAKSGNSDAGSP